MATDHNSGFVSVMFGPVEPGGTGPSRTSEPGATVPLSWLVEQRNLGGPKRVLESSRDPQTTGTWRLKAETGMIPHALALEERRVRLRLLLREEEQQLLRETVEAATAEGPEGVRARAAALRERREAERRRLVTDKMEQLQMERCEQLRGAARRRGERQVYVERAAQLRSREEQRERQQREDALFHELWAADCHAKEERERQQARQRRQNAVEQSDALRRQVEASEERRRRDRVQRDLEAELQRQQREEERLQEQQQQHQKLEAERARWRQLDNSLCVKMKSLVREQQEVLQLDRSILQLRLQDADQRQEAAQKKAALRAEQQVYLQHLWEEQQRLKSEEEETEQLMEETLRETWDRHHQQNQLQQDARNRLMNDVMEARRLQMAHKLHLIMQKQAEAAREREEVNAAVKEMKAAEQEARRRKKEACAAYRADLQAQLEQQQQWRQEQEAEVAREAQQHLIQDQLLQQKRDKLLARIQTNSQAAQPGAS